MAEGSLLPSERLALEKHDFIERVKRGVPPLHAAFDVGWSVSQYNRLQRDPEFKSLLAVALEFRDDTIEHVVFLQAKMGKADAYKFWLQAKRPEVWADRQRVEVTGTATVAVIDVTREALKGFLADPGTRRQAIAALGVGGTLDEIEEAEVIDDSGAG